ncbi:MaoC family dehydratase [Aromatoleum diolicum]|nr:MaoC family dehydratase [Aromatoleum diolicum]
MNAPRPPRIELECGPVSALDLALYAAASGDHNPLHLDADVAKAAGFERPVVHGMLTMAFCGRLLTSHFGVAALRSLSVRFLGAAVRGDRIVLSGTLTSVDKEGMATYELAGHNDAGKELVAGTARVSAPAHKAAP